MDILTIDLLLFTYKIAFGNAIFLLALFIKD